MAYAMLTPTNDGPTASIAPDTGLAVDVPEFGWHMSTAQPVGISCLYTSDSLSAWQTETFGVFGAPDTLSVMCFFTVQIVVIVLVVGRYLRNHIKPQRFFGLSLLVVSCNHCC